MEWAVPVSFVCLWQMSWFKPLWLKGFALNHMAFLWVEMWNWLGHFGIYRAIKPLQPNEALPLGSPLIRVLLMKSHRSIEASGLFHSFSFSTTSFFSWGFWGIWRVLGDSVCVCVECGTALLQSSRHDSQAGMMKKLNLRPLIPDYCSITPWRTQALKGGKETFSPR